MNDIDTLQTFLDASSGSSKTRIVYVKNNRYWRRFKKHNPDKNIRYFPFQIDEICPDCGSCYIEAKVGAPICDDCKNPRKDLDTEIIIKPS